MENLIYEIRGKQVMLDSDLARLYQCKNGTKSLNLAVRRNLDRFPEEFMFQLTKDELDNLRFQIETLNDEYKELRFQIGAANLRSQFVTLESAENLRFQSETAKLRFQNETLEKGDDSLRSQNATLKLKQGQYSKYLPYAFTEQGVAMLASVLHTEKAVETSIKIINTFVKLRKYVSANLLEQKYVNKMALEDHERIGVLEETLDKFEEKKAATEIYFNGQIYDAYSKILEIFREARKSLIIIDAYADKTMLDIIRRLKVKLKLIVKKNSLLSKQDIEKYNEQYGNLEVIYDDSFHDRYFILDSVKVFHCGASVNRIGYKTFSITEVADKEVKNLLIEKIKNKPE